MTGRHTQSLITGLQLENIRSFPDLHLQFIHAGEVRKRTVIIGQNSTGKTTILRSLVLALADYAQATVLLEAPNGAYIAQKQKRARIVLEMTSTPTINKRTIILQHQEDREYVLPENGVQGPAKVFMVGYGVSRTRTGKGLDVTRSYRISDATRTLFDVEAALTNTELNLRRLQEQLPSNRYQALLKNVQRALGLPADHKILLEKGGGISLKGGKHGPLPLEGWADGHRFTFEWIVDVYAWALQHGQLLQKGEVQGILLVDEIEQHLHPSLQVNLMHNLTELFPAMQIIATTHSPLVVMGVEPHEVVVLKKTPEGTQQLLEVPDFRNYSLEDVVEDEQLFNTPALTERTLAIREEYGRLAALAPEERTAQETSKLKELARTLQVPSPVDDPVLEELRKIRAELQKGTL